MTDNRNPAASQPNPIAYLHPDGRHVCMPDQITEAWKDFWTPLYRAATQPPAASQPKERHATLRYERGTPGKENDMPSVVSCNWLPDGDYAVYLAAPQPPAASEPVAAPTPVTDEQIQSLWDVACEASPKTPAWNRHIRFARAVLDLAAVQGKK